ncbi:S41 family peptidase [Thermosediminibacter litoriperuensis]|uniref:Tricorn protease-like protein n=1 Tax=Thermosediminibacter litoriperuensis TaxID=291989 RepID=A0A5S5B0Q5_9FIRM|nr:S41 family peptidase [Thermosediminibacter litoriperuensis]TYP59952.1 tricorn protease-like protein [Thermosediminibacter litoriperuensis]
MSRISKKLLVGVIALVIVGLLYFTWVARVDIKTESHVPFRGLTAKQRLEDFRYLCDILEENYPYLEVLKRKHGLDFEEVKKDFETKVRSARSDAEFYDVLSRFLNTLQNGHTDLVSQTRYKYFIDVFRLYGGNNSDPWENVLNNKITTERYEYWSKIVQEDLIVIPMNFKYVEGRYVKVDAGSLNAADSHEYDIPEGSCLIKINTLPVDEYVASLVDQGYLTYDEKRNKFRLLDNVFPTRSEESVMLTYLTPERELKEVTVKPIKINLNAIAKKDKAYRLFQTHIIEEGRITYLKIPSFDIRYTESDGDKIREFFEKVKDYPYLIIDIRGNGGGDSDYWMKNIVPPLLSENLNAKFYCVFRGGKYIKPFIDYRLNGLLKKIDDLPANKNYPPEIKKDFTSFVEMNYDISPVNPVGFKGRIFLLVDDGVYSSAESFAAFAKATKWATLVGTRTGGDGIGIDPALVALPNSGLIVRFPLDMGLNPDGSANEEFATAPDIFAEWTYRDFLKHLEWVKTAPEGWVVSPYDTVLNTALKIIELDDYNK